MKRMKYSALMILIILMACSSKKSNIKEKNTEINAATETAQTQPKDRIAVLDFKTVNVSADKSRVISELIRTDLINTNKYIVIERSQVDMIFKEHGFSSVGVTDDTNAAKIGKLLTARKILIGTAMKLGESYVITARIVDVEKGIAEYSGKVTAENDESIVGEVGNLVPMLTGGVAEASEVKTKTGKAYLKTSKQSYNVYEDIVVSYKNFPGTKYDYVSIAKEGESARNQYTYQYTSRNKEGNITFYGGVNAAGKWEVRAHTNYDKGDPQPTAVIKFTVK